MGFGNSKKKKETPVENIPNREEIKTYIQICQKKIMLFRNKKIDSIKRKKLEIIDCLQKNNLDLAKSKMDSLMRDEDYIDAYDILGPLIEILLERVIYIDSRNECPPDLRTQLDSIIYAASRLEIEEFLTLKDLIRRKYGQAYITKAENNVDHLINENLISKLQIKLPSEEFLMIRLKQICKEKNIKFDFPNEIPGNLGNSMGASGINPYTGEKDYGQPGNQYGPPPGFNQYGPPPGFNQYGPPPGFNQYGPPPGFNQYGPPKNNYSFNQTDNNNSINQSKNNNNSINQSKNNNNLINQSKNNNNSINQSKNNNNLINQSKNNNNSINQSKNNNNSINQSKNNNNSFNISLFNNNNSFSPPKDDNEQFPESNNENSIAQSQNKNNQNPSTYNLINSNIGGDLNNNMSIQNSQSIDNNNKSSINPSNIIVNVPKSEQNNSKDNNINISKIDDNDKNINQSYYIRKKSSNPYDLKHDYTRDDIPTKKVSQSLNDNNFLRSGTLLNPKENESKINVQPINETVEENKSIKEQIEYNPKKDV